VTLFVTSAYSEPNYWFELHVLYFTPLKKYQYRDPELFPMFLIKCQLKCFNLYILLAY